MVVFEFAPSGTLCQSNNLMKSSPDFPISYQTTWMSFLPSSMKLNIFLREYLTEVAFLEPY
jgi:hypothetical protein